MALQARNEIPERDKWRLEDMVENDAAWESQFAEAKAAIAGMGRFAGTLSGSVGALKAALDAQAETSLLAERLYVYAHMRRDEDNADAKYQGMADRSMALMVELSGAASYIVPEILEIPENTLETWRQDPSMASYRHTLHDLIRSKAHALSREEEKLLAMAGEVAAAPQTIYKMLDNADIRFPSVETPEGPAEISHGSFIHMMQNPDRELRADVFEKFYTTYTGLKNTYAAALSSSIKGDIFAARARHYPSALEASLHDDNVPVSVYDSLIEAVHEKLPSIARYMDMRKRALKLDALHMYDLYAPLSDADFHIEYPDAQRIVMEGLAPLGSDYAAMLRQAFDARWIDVYENRGKSSGAYCWGCYGTHPYVLLNYQPNIDSVFTIAHELGHAMHSHYSDTTQDYTNAQYKIFVAEVASTVNETLLMTHMLAHENDKARRLRLLNYYLEQFRTTVYRQVMFAEFEKLTHTMAESGEALTAEAFEAQYLDLNRLYYGKGMIVDPLIGIEWARISHFYNAFYVYKYATGFSAAVALSRAILEEGAPAAERYHAFLSSGGSDYPLELLKRAGVDLTTPEPVVSALALFDDLLTQFEALV